ncbi:lactate permease [Actinobacillus succinogenes]|uniref:L-lactate permease n=1 Tax=Actinobacillus succinogenes (strain ATCC 55618 / DSM 22257 / CCUG 43843 / 130Z) TaxID=339671 RepID=A6VQS0_ACTSZ|nr:L-lactate permease [Actinobacillus succinogenes]ABR75317.1 L-lactate transport [Actinobacillus succinogenes 130Z]PHI40293.1 lactate permease [Actinobacillus succinogenes]
MAFALSIFPIILLIYLMVKRNALPSYVALPWIAVVVLMIHLAYFGTDIATISANVTASIVAVQTPITVIFGAILFNKFSEMSGVTNVLRRWLGSINPNPVAQLMIIGWAFTFMIEGASGFGTPAAIAAPILVGLGFNPIKVAVLALIMNSVPVSFGAVGTPTWFGFGPLKLSDDQILQIGSMTALIHSFAAIVIPLLALRILVSWKEIRQNLAFIYISIFACVVPYFLIAQINYEFPALVGGAIGLLISVIVANRGIGLTKAENTLDGNTVPAGQVAKALLPTAMLIAILIITRIQQLPFKAWMNDTTTWFVTRIGSLGDFEVSRGLVFSLKNIFDTPVSVSYKLLYVPALIPFIVTVLIAIPLFSMSCRQTREIFAVSLRQSKNPFIALVGALIMVNLMLVGGDGSMVKTIGKTFAETTGEHWTWFSSYLGAVGSFFSGSNTVSNLTFGSVQLSTAELTGLSTVLVLALQSVGGAMGNMVCINNIVAVSSVLNIDNQEGNIIKQTVIPMFIYGVIAALVALFVLPLFFNL